MISVGKYEKEGECRVVHYPVRVDKDVESTHTNYYIEHPCTQHKDCVNTTFRGIDLHGKRMEYECNVLSDQKIYECEHPIYYSFEAIDSHQPPLSNLESMELFDYVCLFY